MRPVHVAAVGGEARWWGGSLAVIKATAAETGGAMSVVEVIEPAGYEAPLHVHHAEDEAFWVLAGTVTFEIGGERIAAATGDFAFGPRGVPHRYTVGPDGCTLLFVLTPGGFEDVVRAMSVPAEAHRLPDREHEPPDLDRAMAVAEGHAVELLDA